MTLLQKNLSTQIALRKWNKTHFGFIKDRINKLLLEIVKVQGLPATVSTKNLGSHLRGLLDEQLQREQILWIT